ncbi:MAG TPA: dihydropteroate synthase [Nitrososphaerales archaeon]|nr:dihydropteroate synthase [Nitrososphaerales archaeon]
MKITGLMGTVPVGDKTRIMGVINVSPESFYKHSVKISAREIAKTAEQMEEQGADFIDIGAMSTAPYLKTMISIEKEIERLKRAIRIVKHACNLPISIDTPRSKTAEEALNLGADIINDVTGLKYDPEMARIATDHDASVILSAYEKRTVYGNAVKTTVQALRKSIKIASNAGIRSNRIIVDPAIGFFRAKGNNPFFTRMKGTKWLDRDLILIGRLKDLQILRKPICISVSRKSFIGKILNIEHPEDRLFGSLAAETICALNGAHIIRTHNVSATMQAVKIAEALMSR